jgi:quinol-cytochrome oxidoreductase complex cytochrome b subunit
MRYDKWKWGLEPFYPNHMLYQGIITAAVLLLFFAVVFFAPGVFMLPETPANPASTPEHVKPEWYFLPTYQWLKFFPVQWFPWAPWLPALLGVASQGLVFAAILCWPFLDRKPERDIRRRPRLFVLATLGVLFFLALGLCGADPLGANEVVRPAWYWRPAYASVQLLVGAAEHLRDWLVASRPGWVPLARDAAGSLHAVSSPFGLYALLFGIYLEVLLLAGAVLLPAIHLLRRRDAPARPRLLYLGAASLALLVALGLLGAAF